MSHFVHSWDGLRRSRIVQVLIVTFVSLIGGIALIATSSGDANARTPVAQACGTASPTWSLTSSSGPPMVWSNPAFWTGPVCGEYPGQNSSNGGTQTGLATVNVGLSSITLNFDPPSSTPINVSFNGFSQTFNVTAPLTLQGSSTLGSGGTIVNVPTGGTLTNSAGASIIQFGPSTLNLTGGTIINDGSINNISTFNLTSGVLSGSGSITTPTLTNSGVTITGMGGVVTQSVVNLGVTARFYRVRTP